MKNIFKVLGEFESRVRGWFSHRPVLYALVGGVGVVLFWRGVWHSADAVSAIVHDWSGQSTPIDWYALGDGFLSLLVGFSLLASTGLFISDFIGAEVIESDLEGEEKLTKKAEKEVESEEDIVNKIHHEVHGLSKRLKKIEKQNGGTERKK